MQSLIGVPHTLYLKFRSDIVIVATLHANGVYEEGVRGGVVPYVNIYA